jgi:hypothetical protein
MGSLKQYQQVIINGECHPSLYTVLIPTALSAAIVASFPDNADLAQVDASCAEHFAHFAIVHDSLIVRSH